MSSNFVPLKYKNIEKNLKELKSRPDGYWLNRGRRRALKLFHEMATKVPAYKSFLKKHKINHAQIKTFKDFQGVPPVNKENYLKKYPLKELCWDGKFKEKDWVIASTSGSTGKPFYFPREEDQDLQYAATAEMYLVTNFEIHKKSTLYIDAFPMGAWIGGLFTYEAIRTIAKKSAYKLSIITPGIDKQEIINIVKKFGHEFDQIIIGCYGPFLKDTIDDGIRQKVNWKKYNLKFIFSAEGFTENFRNYIIKHTGLKNPYKDTLNHYGTVDQGTLSYETPLSILIRRLAIKTPVLYKSIFPVKHKLPTLTQYDPEMFFFEEVKGELLCSSYSGLPLSRYDLKDHGGIIEFDDMMKKIADSGIKIKEEIKKADIKKTIWKLPFVYVYERKDFSVSLYAFQIYPETIRKVLQRTQFHPYLTGKFSMLVKFNKQQNQYLEINIELKTGKKESKKLEKELKKLLIKQLLTENSEYRETYSKTPNRIAPNIVFWPYESSKYFDPGSKQKWILKNKK